MSTLPDTLTHLLFKMCMTSFQTSADVRKNLCGHLLFTSMLSLKSEISAKVHSKNKKNPSQNFIQAYLRRAADVRKQTTPADMEKCPQKSAGFDKGTDICGFLVDIHQLPQKFRQMYADVHSICKTCCRHCRYRKDNLANQNFLVGQFGQINISQQFFAPLSQRLPGSL